MTRRPPVDDLLLASDWLDSYESEPGDDAADRCAAVAAWLRHQVAAASTNAAIRAKAREFGVKPSVVRAALKRKMEVLS